MDAGFYAVCWGRVAEACSVMCGGFEPCAGGRLAVSAAGPVLGAADAAVSTVDACCLIGHPSPCLGGVGCFSWVRGASHLCALLSPCDLMQTGPIFHFKSHEQ